MAQTRTASGDAPRTELSRDLGLWDITLVGVAGMIGAGIFVLTGIAAGQAGPALLLAFALNGVVTLLTGMVYAELGSAIPEAGGGYLWVREGLPDPNALLAGWMSWFAHAVVGSVYALGFAAYLEVTLQYVGLDFPVLHGVAFQKVFAALIAVAVIYINFRGASETSKAGMIVTVGKLLIIWFFVAAGLVAMLADSGLMSNFSNLDVAGLASELKGFAPMGIAGVFTAMGLTFIAFEGYEIIAQAGEEVKHPRRNVPKAVFLALAIVIPTYIAVAFVALGAVRPPAELGPTTTWKWLSDTHGEVALARAAEGFMGSAAVLLLIGALMSTVSALIATTYSSTRVSFALGRDRNLPDFFAAIHPRTRIPYGALIASGLLIIAMAVAIPLEAVAAAADIMFMLLFLQVNVACITIRKKYGDKLRYGYMAPFFPWVPIVAIIVQLALIVFMFIFSPLAGLIAFSWVGGGVLVHRFYSGKRRREVSITPIVAEVNPPPEHRGFSVMVPVANPETAGTLLQVADRILDLRPGNLVLAHVVTVPDALPVSVGTDFIAERQPLLSAATRQAEQLGRVPTSLIRVGHRAADAIIDTVEDHRVGFVIMGWAGRSSDPRTVVGSTIDRIVKDANTNVVVVRGDVQIPARRILVPVQHPQHGRLMAEFAAAMATETDAYIRLLHIVPADMAPAQRAEAARQLREAVGAPDEHDARDGATATRQLRFQIRIESGDVVDTLIEQSADFDLMLMGASRESWWRRKVWGDKTARVASAMQTPLMLVNLRSGRLKYGVSKFFQFFWDVEQGVE